MITSFDSLIGMNVRFWAKLLDMIDYFKWPEVFAVPNQKPETIA